MYKAVKKSNFMLVFYFILEQLFTSKTYKRVIGRKHRSHHSARQSKRKNYSHCFSRTMLIPSNDDLDRKTASRPPHLNENVVYL